jgi:hypothetical protein
MYHSTYSNLKDSNYGTKSTETKRFMLLHEDIYI